MKKLLYTLATILSISMNAQISPQSSPYLNFGVHSIVADSDMSTSPMILTYRPSSNTNAPYPVFIFQLGANGFGSSAINVHSYDIYLKHLASYGYVIIVVNDPNAGFPNGTTFTSVHNWFKAKVIDNTHWMNQYADPNKVIVAGHSNGGVNATALLINRPTEIAGIVYFAAYPSSPFPNHDVSNYTGKVLSLAGTEDNLSSPSACKTGYNKYTSSSCKVWALITGLHHGGFGDYVNAQQPVGSIGRADATATIRHYLVSFMESQFKNDVTAHSNLFNSLNRPNSTNEFLSTCTSTSIDDSHIHNNTISIYPNPAQDKITLEFTNINPEKLEITSLLNQTILIENCKLLKSELNIEQLKSGVYILSVYENEKVHKIKFIKN